MRLSPSISLRINPHFIQYIHENYIVFVSGCNLVIYDCQIKAQRFLMRKHNALTITYLSIGSIFKTQLTKDISSKIINMERRFYKRNSIDSIRERIEKNKEILICLGEYSEKEKYSYLTVIKPMTPNIQYTIKSPEKYWKINFASILNNTNYCISISQKLSSNKKIPIQSKISFAKYTQEQFLSEEVVNEELIYCCYNPKNTIELVVCGKGYLRLWNIFINEKSLKEHQYRYLKGKKEKIHTFIKAQFFEKKSFLLIVGTAENLFFIIENFDVLHEIDVCYSLENIYDLNIQNVKNEDDDDDNIGNLKEILDNMNTHDIDNKLKELTILTSNENKDKFNSIENGNFSQSESYNSSETEAKVENPDDKNDVFQRLYKGKEDDTNDGKIERTNKVKFFELLNDNLLFVIYNNDGIVLLYKIDWNIKIKDEQNEEDFRNWNAYENRVIRIAKNIKTITNFSINKSSNDIILMVDSYVNKNKKGIISTSLFKMKKVVINDKHNPNMIIFDDKLFTGYFEHRPIKMYDLNEKKELVYIIGKDNILECFDCLKNEYIIRHPFQEKVLSISACPLNNLLALSFPNKVSIFSKIKKNIVPFCEFEVSDSIVKFNAKGNFLLIGGLNRNEKLKKTYCLYFIDTFTLNTVHVLENLAYKIKRIKFFSNDKYIFIELANSYIIGYYVNTQNNSLTMHEMYQDRNEDIANGNLFKIIFRFNPGGKVFECFDYDDENYLLAALQVVANKMGLISNYPKNEKRKNFYTEFDCTLNTMKIVKELGVLIGGDKDGSIKVYKWPFKKSDNDEIININNYFLNSINLHNDSITFISSSKNYSKFITMGNDSNLLISRLQIEKYDSFKDFEYFTKPSKPHIETFILPYSMYEMKNDDIKTKEKNVEILENAVIKLKQTMDENIEDIRNMHNTELENMKNNLKQNIDDEDVKFTSINDEINTLRNNMAVDLNKRLEELDKDKVTLTNKYNDKIELYNGEINRLKNELQGIKDSIEEKYNNEIQDQKEFYDKLIKDYNQKFTILKDQTNSSLVTLVNISSEYDEASEKIVEDYKKLVENLDHKIKETIEVNNQIIKEGEEKLREAKLLEDQHKIKLEEKVKESDKLIEKNVEIKQSIINATQRTITFQEQLLETEKNLVKIEKKLDDLVTKNKHLEQIRFVLEHRMTSLEKEKAPLEGQCAFLENQKNKLTEEFNKIILQINMHNQQLENKQSQLRASLIQNYEVHDQKNYVQRKLTQLKGEMEQFLMNYQETDENKLSNENKTTRVALNFKKFYDKYFSNPIEEELANYQYYSQKLQEQADKDGIANNFDLIMRNKAEEKLISEKEKVEELKNTKEKGFRRIQNENTILIAECNRLRKNLHEIYMHVVDIEQRFEQLTKINPKLSKSEIVAQIKEFIKATHEKIKANYSKNKKPIKNNYFTGNNSFRDNSIGNEESKMYDQPKNDYEGLIKLPEIKNKSLSFLSQNKQDIFDGDQSIEKSNK